MGEWCRRRWVCCSEPLRLSQHILVRLADPSLYSEAITCRPLFLTAIATRTRHARQATIRVTNSHAKAAPPAQALAAVAAFLWGLAKNAEQLTRLQTWRAILSRAFQAFLNGRLLRAPPASRPPDATQTRKTADHLNVASANCRVRPKCSRPSQVSRQVSPGFDP